MDADVELGRYPAAAASVQRMVDLRPSLASLSRVSYLRELYGDHAGALTAMGQALVAGSSSAYDLAYIDTLLGDLHLAAGQLDAAGMAYGNATAQVSGYPLAEVGLARVAAARGQLDAAARLLGAVVVRLPLPDAVALYGDVLAALHRPVEAARQYALVRVLTALQRNAGIVVDLENARFEADHARDPGGRPAVALSLARAALQDRPTIYAADVLGWALRQAGEPARALPYAVRATRLGTRDALLWWHRAAIEADLGRLAAARDHLRLAVAITPHPPVHDRAAFARLAARLSVPMPVPPATGG